MSRKHFSQRERVRLFELHGRACHICGVQIQIGEKFELEHIIPWHMTRDDSDENVKPAHVKCHRVKSNDDIRDIRKSQRVAAKHQGTYPPSRTPLRSRGFQKRQEQ